MSKDTKNVHQDNNETRDNNETGDIEKQENQKTQEAPQESEEQKLDELSTQIEELKGNILRERAENENIRKRFAKELEDKQKYALTDFAKDLLEVSENMYRALESIPQDQLHTDDLTKKIFEGVEMTQKTLLSTFEKYGINRIHPEGENFDHNYHQAISSIETGEDKPNIIVQVIQAGYTLNDRLLRPALVIVSK